MTRIVIDNGAVVTMDDAMAVHHGGTVVIEDDRIIEVGSSARSPSGGPTSARAPR